VHLDGQRRPQPLVVTPPFLEGGVEQGRPGASRAFSVSDVMRRAYRLFGTGRPLTVATALNEHFAGPPVWTA